MITTRPLPVVAASFVALLQTLSFAQSLYSEDGDSSRAPAVRDEAEPPEGLSAQDWAGIREAHEASRHAFTATAEGFVARSPRQGWATGFDGQGFTLTPDAGNWTFGLELERFGFAGRERALDAPEHACVDGQRLRYDWGADLSEWWVNDTRGLEHGFTVHRAPPGVAESCDATLRFELAVRGALVPSVTADRRGARLVDASNAAVLTYGGLVAFDANGALLEAWLEADSGRLRIIVHAEGARYPITVDPVVQSTYLKASNTGAGDGFGRAVAIAGDTVIVGAPQEDSNANIINCNEADNSAPDSGAAYVFARTGATWSQQAYLKASNAEAGDRFGLSVAISGDTVVVGALFEDSNAENVGGGELNNAALDSGAAYVFVRTGTTWSQQAYLKASNTGAGDNFAVSVAISGDTVVVGARDEDSNGVNGPLNNSAGGSGAAYIFTRTGMSWSTQAYLKASNTGIGDQFGFSVAIDGDTVVVGAYFEDSNGSPANELAPNSGAAYVFVRSLTVWSEQAYLKASNVGLFDALGYAVAIAGDTVVVGAYGEDSNATDVGGDQSNNLAPDSGAAYVFTRAGTAWSQQAYLKASNTGANDQFGPAVAIAGDTVVVGAYVEDSNATGLNGNQADNSAGGSGAAYIFTRTGASWSTQSYLKASNTGMDDWFGLSVALAGDTVVVGAYLEDSNGSQADNSASDSGAAYTEVLWWVNDPLFQIQQMIAYVLAWNLPQHVEDNLVDRLIGVIPFINSNNTVACNRLGALINHVEAQSGKSIPLACADALISSAGHIINLLCP